MDRNVIHRLYPFTEEEDAAAWILLGTSADDAIRAAAQTRTDLEIAFREPRADDEAESGWFVEPGVHLVGAFAPAIHLAADIASGGNLLSDIARAAWLELWHVR